VKKFDVLVLLLMAAAFGLLFDTSLIGVLAMAIVVLAWLSVIVTRGWPFWLRVALVAGVVAVPGLGFVAVVVVARSRARPVDAATPVA
jgi:hypothetical protein